MKIKNWSQFQHFKDRRPPWIKLYRDLLDDVEWHELDAEAAKVLVMLWLIASEHDGCLPDARVLSFRLRLPEKQVKSIVSKLSHWLDQDDIAPISERYQDDLPETERETEERQRESVAIAPSAPAKKAIEGKTGSRLPTDWQPSDEDKDFATKSGVPWNSEAEKFRDYWSAQAGAKGRKTDWTATWRNWIRRAAERRKDWPSIGAGAGAIRMAPVAPQKPAKPMSPQEEFDSKYRSGSYAQTIGHRYIRYLEQEWPWWNAAWGPSPGEDGSEFTPELLDELRKAREALDHSVFGREAIYTWAGAVSKPIAHDDVIEF